MVNIEKRHIIDSRNLRGDTYLTSILQEAYACGLLSDSEVEGIQMQCIKLLAYKSERYSCGDSSSIRIEVAEAIMKSNLYTIGLYLKSLPDADSAVNELKGPEIREMYEKGRKLINARVHAAKHIYELARENRLETVSYTYNATLDSGIGSFFELYNPDYEAHESSASIDYQLCNAVTDLEGVEYIQKYLENLYLENQFCAKFHPVDIHHLLCGYHEGYKDLLINIFEHVLTAAIGCHIAKGSALNLNITQDEVQRLQSVLSKEECHSIASVVRSAAEGVLKELDITSVSLQRYIEKSFSKITSYIANAVKTNTLDKVFVTPVNQDLKPKIEFLSSAKMDDGDYRKLIDELLICRHSSDKIVIVKEKVKSFDDFEDLLFDAELSEEEITSALGILGDVEMAALIRRHPFKMDIEAVDLSEEEQEFRSLLKRYADKLPAVRQEQISQIMI